MKNHRIVTFAVVLSAALQLAGAPFYVDLSGAANISRYDDGIAGNGVGGWSDEGINDMFVYPEIPSGELERNNYRMKFLDDNANGGRSVIMLRRNAGDVRLPQSVEAAAAGAKGKYIYFYHHMVRDGGSKDGDVMAVYTVEYQDGRKVDFPMVKGKQLLQWWSKNWWENREDQAWPVVASRNAYSSKYGSLIMLWATRSENPYPETPISRITFKSADAEAAVTVWAVTIDDADYRAVPEKNQGNVWGRPPAPPEEFFDDRMADEFRRICDSARSEGMIEGVRKVELLKPDLLAVTVDSGWCGMAGTPANKFHLEKAVPENFTVTGGDPAFRAGVRPSGVGHMSFEGFNGSFGGSPLTSLYYHTFFLRLPKPLVSGNDYEVKVTGMPEGMRDKVTLSYDERKSSTPVIKVNQAAYSGAARRRYAYLGWWAGSFGAVDYSGFKKFEVLSDKDGKAVMSGEVRFRDDVNKLTGEERVGEMDISALPDGRYRVHVPGLGVSAPFEVGKGGSLDAFYLNTQRAFFHQRCGQELNEPYTKIRKPACHLYVDEDGKMHASAEDAEALGRKVRKYVGGYHDAADFDHFTYHLRATAQQLDVYDAMTAYCMDDAWNIPESGNGIPDVLDEAAWALRWYMENQEADGGVPKGRCNDQDSRRQKHVVWGPFGIFRPDAASNYEYAATAAAFSRLYRKYDPALAERYLQSAVKAFKWAAAQPPPPAPVAAPGKRPPEADTTHTAFSLWASSSLYRAGAGKEYLDFFNSKVEDGKFKVQWKLGNWEPLLFWQYIRSELPVDAKIRAALVKRITDKADIQIRNELDLEPYRSCARMAKGVGFGSGVGGGFYADTQLRAWLLSGAQKYLDAASLNADFLLGCNPLGKTFVSGVGTYPVEHPQISEFLYEKPGKRGSPLPGITVYGLCTNREIGRGYLPEPPKMRRWRDLGNGGAELYNEFTVPESIGHTAMLSMAMRAIEAGFRPVMEPSKK